MEGIIDRSVLGAPEFSWVCPKCGATPKYDTVWRDRIYAERALVKHLEQHKASLGMGRELPPVGISGQTMRDLR